MSAGSIQAASAGSHPKPLHPNAVRVLQQAGNRHQRQPHQALRRIPSPSGSTRSSRCATASERSAPSSRPPRARRTGACPTRRSTVPPTRPRTRRSNAPRTSSRRASASGSTCSPTQQQRGGPRMPNDEIINVRYMVDDVEESIAFYTKVLGFEVLTSAAPAFADVKRGNLRLLLSGPKSSAGRPMPDGAKPGPGRLEPHPLHRRRPRHRSRTAPRRRRRVPQRRRGRARRQADPAPRPVRQRRRALPASQSLNDESAAAPSSIRSTIRPRHEPHRRILDQRRDRRRNAATTARRGRCRGHRCRFDDRRRRVRRLGTGGGRGR